MAVDGLQLVGVHEPAFESIENARRFTVEEKMQHFEKVHTGAIRALLHVRKTNAMITKNKNGSWSASVGDDTKQRPVDHR